MGTAADWRSIFEHWPKSLPRSGMLTTSFQETIGFSDFRVSSSMLLIERDRPDALGARKVMLTFESIVAVKLSDPGDLAKYEPLGFEPVD